ncbi:hypothetical protein AAFF_G00148860 [Aldrovandia affinis]|uniref:Uncharacterized protein n=1 Tax=Aldrovandia affinis TaxID=143900 RepID=A0AAD7RPV7_9TELE|nr:hypothetical protein AAFF_G00148860 [Aldrovandia affinis]
MALQRRRGQRGVSSTFSVDFNNADVSLEQVLQTPFRLTVKSRQDPTKKKRRERERDQPNGQPATTPEGSIAESEVTQSLASPDNKSLKPRKKKRKTDHVEKSVVLLSNDLFSTKDRSEEEEAGVWERKMSSREKRQLRKERMKRKESPRGGSQQRPLLAEVRWNIPPHPEGEWQPCLPMEMTGGPVCAGPLGGPEGRITGGPRRETRPQELGKAGKAGRRAVEWAPPIRLEEDIFSHVGTWDSKDVKTEPVTFGTVPDLSSEFGNGSSQPSPSQEEWCSQMMSLGVEEAWLGLEDSLDVDQNSDWKPPTEEWGNWGGEEGSPGHEGGQGQGIGRKTRVGHKVPATEQGAESAIRPTPADVTDGKKDRKKKRRMRKET